MGAPIKTIEVDGEKLELALRVRNLLLAEASQEMGYNRQYLTKRIKGGGIPLATAKMLELKYGIKPEDQAPYVAEQRAEEEPKSNMNELYKTVYAAVYNAVKQAWRDS